MTRSAEPPPTTGPGYAPAGFFMLRAPLLPAAVFTHVTGEDGDRPDEDPVRRSPAHRRAESRERLWALAADPRVHQALHAASPSLTGRLARMRERPLSERATERVYATLLRYLTRMSSRATPYGLFAGVAIAGFGEATSIGLAADPVSRTRTRSDFGWLAEVVERLESDEESRDGLPVLSNHLLYRSAGRVFLPATGGSPAVSMRVTAPVEAALCLADGELTYGGLVAELRRRFPRASGDGVRRMLARMWDLHILISGLCAPMAPGHPEDHLAERVGGSPGGAAVADGLRRSRKLADAVDAARGRAEPGLLGEFVTHQRSMVPGFDGSVHQTDTVLATLGTGVSRDVAATAAQAGDLMMRLYCTHPRLQHIVDYHDVFIERYGHDSQIPLLDVLSLEKGIGPPNPYLGPPRQFPLPETSAPRHERRDRALVELATSAARLDRLEMPLTDADVAALTVWSFGDRRSRPAPSLDLYARIAAESREAIDEGAWRMVLMPGVFRGLQSFGRFAGLFDDDLVDGLRRFARDEEERNRDLLFAELNAAPWVSRMQNLTTRPPIRQYEICVNARPALPPGRQIPLSDILVSADVHGFQLRSAALDRRLMVTRTHAVTVREAPNVCRALLELSADTIASPSYFDWGPMNGAPFLPRLVRDRIVLSPAQWTLSSGSFGAGEALSDPDRFSSGIQHWRKEWGVPRHVQLAESDNRLLLDLEHPLCLDELRRHLQRSGRDGVPGTVRLLEMLPDFSQLWLSDEKGRRYHAELVIPVVSTTSNADPAEDSVPARPERPAATRSVNRRWFPGQEWVFLKLYAPMSHQDDVITGPLRRLLARLREAGLTGRWFYVRYADSLPHLRLRFHATEPSTVMALCADWARTVVESGWASDFAFASYDRELERYGGAEAIDTLEEVFHANSEATAGLLEFMRGNDADPEIVCVTALHALCQSWGTDPLVYGAGGEYASIPDSTHARFRAVRPLLCELLVPGHPKPDPRAAAYAAGLRPIFERQHRVVAGAGERIREVAAAGRLHGGERGIVDSLNHMQVNRLLGLGWGRERHSRGLWTLAARAIAHRPPAGRDITRENHSAGSD
jgi:thiopeptide-type bacteriocin biosynthesis protein